ncbi:cyclase family protein [Candidatus Micrarchaeota archaeon]|nr:cyclase family protein [Candidatus Micrarchaeota archaeon]
MIIDLTLEFSTSTPVYPGDPKPEFIQSATIGKNGYNAKKITFGNHFSTHIDAPFHMVAGGKKLDEFPVETFTGSGIVLDGENPDLEKIEPGDIVFFRGKISEDAARQLVRKKVKMAGTDEMSPDDPPFNVHKLLLQNNILIVENLANLDKLAGKRCTFFVLPIKLADSDAAPCRAIAIL